jgi:trehalose utilization protein
MNVLVWCEERLAGEALRLHPHGLGRTIAGLLPDGDRIACSRLDDAQLGLADAVLDACDVLVWWAHQHHAEIPERDARRVQMRVLAGMGLVVLHSALWSRPFLRLLGTSGQVNYRMTLEPEHLWVVDPGHPVAAGLGSGFVILREEPYCEPFDVPAPDELVLISSFAGGEAFRSGCGWRRGAGRIFYLRPGHETSAAWTTPGYARALANAVQWAMPRARMPFESGPKALGWLAAPPSAADAPRVIGSSHAFADLLPSATHLR